MLNFRNRIVVKGVATASLVGIAVGVGADAGAQEADLAADRAPCHVDARIEVRYDDDHPRRVGFVETDENCVPSVRYEDMSLADWAVLNDTEGRGGTEETRRLDPTGVASSFDLGATYVVRDTEAALPRAAASHGTRTPHGYHRVCHDLPGNCVGEVEVDTWFTFSYNGTDEVTSYSEGYGHRWWGGCWTTRSPWYVNWVTSDMPDAISVEAESGFHVPWWTFCPDLGYGGEIYVKTWGAWNGTYGVICVENFTAPWPSDYPCWAELD